jgi:hypothetical protein
MAKSVFEDMTEEQLQAMLNASEVTPAGQILFEEAYIDPCGDGVDHCYDWDAQPRETTDGRDLVESFQRLGMIEKPMLCRYKGVDLPEVARGHRRLNGAKTMKEEMLDEYNRVFPQGVAVKIAVGKIVNGETMELTHRDMHLLRVDHDLDSLKQTLTSVIEAYKMVCPLFRAGLSYSEVIEHTWRTVSRLLSTKYNELVEEVKGLPRSLRLKVLERSQHGNYQFLKALSDAPDALIEAWKAGVKGNGPKLTQATIKGLVSEFRKAKDEIKNVAGSKPLTREKPGEEWLGKLQDAITKAAAPKDTTEAGPKMVKKTKVEEMRDSVTSQSLRLAFQSVLGVAGAEKMLKNNYDKDISIFEQIREERPRFAEFVLSNGLLLEHDLTRADIKALKTALEINPDSAHAIAAQAAAKGGPKADAGTDEGKAKGKAKAKTSSK